MWEVHHEIARLVLLGYKNVDIAEKLDCSPQLVSNVRNSPVVKEKLALMRGARDADTIDIAKEIKEIAPEALNLLKNEKTKSTALPSIAYSSNNNYLSN